MTSDPDGEPDPDGETGLDGETDPGCGMQRGKTGYVP